MGTFYFHTYVSGFKTPKRKKTTKNKVKEVNKVNKVKEVPSTKVDGTSSVRHKGAEKGCFTLY